VVAVGVQMPDADLVRRCRDGDGDAWRALVERYGRYVHAIVTRGYGLHGDDAEDTFQEVFTRVFERLGTLREPDALRPWIAQMTRRCCVDRLRVRRAEPLDAISDEAPAPEVLAELDEALDVRLALARLSDDCAEVIDRFFCRDESYRTIGEALDLPPGTIASRISRCLDKLRAALAYPEEGRADPVEGRNDSSTASGV
jgi:RNA polymerase sigma-70 factor (ECF subfamily)